MSRRRSIESLEEKLTGYLKKIEEYAAELPQLNPWQRMARKELDECIAYHTKLKGYQGYADALGRTYDVAFRLSNSLAISLQDRGLWAGKDQEIRH